MNSLKLEKPLIEWEKELDVWLVDLDLKNHLVSYNKMDAFNKIFISNLRRGWKKIHYNLYYTVLLGNSFDSLVLDEFKSCYMDNYDDAYEEKPLIEWEKEYGVWMSNLDYDDHFKKCYRYKAELKVKKYLNIFVWNNDAQSVYNSYKGINDGKYNKINNIVEEKKVDDLKVNKKKNDFHIIFKPLSVKKTINKKKLKNSLVKKSIALALTISTVVSGFLMQRLSVGKDNNINTNVYASNNLGNNSIFKLNDILLENQEKPIKSDNECVNDYLDINNKDSISNDNKVKNLIMESDDLSAQYDEESSFKIGDVVSIESNSDIYTNCYDAMNESNGLDPYFSLDYDRTITGVCINNNGKIIYSTNNNEASDYISSGGEIISYTTKVDNVDEGFYEVSDVKVLKKTNSFG